MGLHNYDHVSRVVFTMTHTQKRVAIGNMTVIYIKRKLNTALQLVFLHASHLEANAMLFSTKKWQINVFPQIGRLLTRSKPSLVVPGVGSDRCIHTCKL